MTDPGTAEPASEPTTTTVLEYGAEVHARIGTALAAVSDAAELAAEAGALPELVARSVLRSLSQAHRHLSDADAMTSAQAIGGARVVELAAADATRKVICSCGRSFVAASWDLHRAGQEHEHTLAGELVSAGPATRRRVVDVLLERERERG